MVDKIDHLYLMLDDLDEDLQAMQEDLETVIELIESGDTKKAVRILAEMNTFLIEFLEPEEECDEECECVEIDIEGEEEEKPEEKPAPKKAGKPKK